MNDLNNKSIGRYQLLEQTGSGGMAIVYKALDTRLDSLVAVKVLRTERLSLEILDRTLKRFANEARSVARLTHPNLVKVMDYGEDDGRPYLVMPYFSGGTLKEMMGKPIPWRDAVELLLPIAGALDYAHSQQMIHRDVKPSNILLTDRGHPMLSDFGLAKMMEEPGLSSLSSTSGVLGVGTPEYMAPEQWSGKVSPQTDIYSFGLVLYELITGRKPYEADTPADLHIKQFIETVPVPSQFISDLPAEVEETLLKALAKKPEDRHESMGQLSTKLKNLLQTGQSAQDAVEMERRAAEITAREQAERDALEKVKQEAIEKEKLRRKALLAFWKAKIATMISKAGPSLKWVGLLVVILMLVWTGIRTVIIFRSRVPSVMSLFSANNQEGFYFTSSRDGKIDIYALDASKEVVRLLSTDRKGGSWSPVPDGTGNVYFTSDRDGKTDIYALNAKGKVTRLLNADRRGQNWSPAPDGFGNLYFTSDQDGKTDIYVLTANGKVTRLLKADRPGENWAPAPDGFGNLFFTSDHDGKTDIYVLTEKGDVKRLLNADRQGDNWSPVPDGRGNLYFTSEHDGKTDIYSLTAKGKVTRLLNADRQGENWSPVPDGNGNVYFTSDPKGYPEIYFLNTKGDVTLIDAPKSSSKGWTGYLNDQYPRGN